MFNENELIEAYLQYYRTKDGSLFWAWEEVDQMRAIKDLPFTLRLLQACQDDDEIAYTAAGPLKEIFSIHHAAIKEELIVMIKQHSCMQKAIQAFLLSPNTSSRNTLDDILQQLGLHYASL